MTTTEELLSMDQAADYLSTSRATLYRWLREGRLQGMKVGRQWRFESSELERFLHGKAPQVDLPANIGPFLQALDRRVTHTEPRSEDPLQDAFSLMVRLALERGASSLHLGPCYTPEAAGAVSWLRCRVNGVLEPVAPLDNRLVAPLIAYWKKAAACYAAETSVAQDGRIVLASGNSPETAQLVDVLVSFLPTSLGERMTARFLDEREFKKRLNDLGMEESDRQRVKQALRQRSRMVVLSGASGSDRDTILASLLREVAGPQINLMTLGCPAWQAIPWASVVSLSSLGQSRSYAVGVNTMLRSDPDVIGLGNLPDEETVRASQEAVLRGALVLAAMNGHGAISTLRSLVEMSSSPLLLAQTLELLVSQRFLRTLCTCCAQANTPDALAIERLHEAAQRGCLSAQDFKAEFKAPTGCSACGGSGYQGRTLVFETLPVSARLINLIASGAGDDSLSKEAAGLGLTSLDAKAARLAFSGVISTDEALRFLPPNSG